jgi:hypothetical protein
LIAARLFRGPVRGAVVEHEHVVQLRQRAPRHGLDFGLLEIRRDQCRDVGPVDGRHYVAG